MYARIKTGVATFVQFILGAGLSFISGGSSIIVSCRGSNGVDCVTNAFVSLVLVLLTIVAYGALLGVGYFAQERRDARLAAVLIGAEVGACIIFLFDARHAPDLIDRAINILGLVIAVWVIYIAWRQFRAKSGRMVTSRRHR